MADPILAPRKFHVMYSPNKNAGSPPRLEYAQWKGTFPTESEARDYMIHITLKHTTGFFFLAETTEAVTDVP